MKIFLGNRKHTARSAGRVINRLDNIVTRKNVVIITEKDIDHQADNFSRRIVLPGVLVMSLGKAADNFFKDIAHFNIGNHIGVQIGFRRCELLDYDIQNALVSHCGNVTVKLELFDNVPDVFGKALQVRPEIRLDMIRIIKKPLKSILACVIERMPRRFTKKHVFHLKSLYLVVFFEYCVLCVGKNAVKTADNRQRQNHFAIFVRLIHSGQLIGNRPDQGGFFVNI